MKIVKTIKLTKKEIESLNETADILDQIGDECPSLVGVDLFQFGHSNYTYDDYELAVDIINDILNVAKEES